EDPGVAVGASLLLFASPLALYYGSVGLTYAPELLLSLVVAGLAWSVKSKVQSPKFKVQRQIRTMNNLGLWTLDFGLLERTALLGLALGVAGGVRQTSLLVLFPLCAWALWGSPLARWATFVLSLVVTVVAWLVPLLAMSGGPG